MNATSPQDHERLETLNAVLRVAVKHPNLLKQQAFEELCDAVTQAIPIMRLGVVVPDGPGFRRVYAVARATESSAMFGLRIPAVAGITELVFAEGKPYVCDDTRVGEEAERMGAAQGVLSLASVPVLVEGEARVVAELVFAFSLAGAAGRASMPLLVDIAAAIAPSVARAIHGSRERRLAMIIDTSADAMLAWDRQLRITDANNAAARLTRRRRDELIGMSIDELFGPLPGASDDRPPTQGVRLELTVRTPLGPRRVVVAATITPVDDDPLVAANALLRDLSHVVAAEREAATRLSRIHELEEQHRTLLDNAPLIIFRLDPETRMLQYLNRHAERLLGVPTSEALQTPGFLREAHADPDGVASFVEAVELAGQGVVSRPYEARLRHRHGGDITARGTVYPLLSERGEVVAIEGVLADVSAEHAARTRLVQADRLSTLGMLAAGVAHEINNPAAFILLGLDMLDRLLKGPGVTLDGPVAGNAGDLLRDLRDSIRRIVDIARDLRLFASPPAADSGRRAIIDVNRAIESALSLTRGQIIERARIEKELAEVPPVLMDDGRLGQVIVNLLVNAAQAMPRGIARDNRISVSSRGDGRTVEIDVTDTGAGIPEDIQGRIWQPFFTTKAADVGTGLGLSISREIVERAGGTITVESPIFPAGPKEDAPYGARFLIKLPAAGRGELRTPVSTTIPRVPAARVRLLLVEDEPALARALAEELGLLHHVTVAGGGQAALDVLAKARFDVVLCDLRMPGMSGEALYAKVLEQDPEQARGFIFMTGVGFGADVERFIAAVDRPLLEKPFDADAALLQIVRVVNKNSRRHP